MSLEQKLIPELYVTNLEESLTFYTDLLGFALLYDRPDERFVMLQREGAHIMLEEVDGPGRRFNVGKLEKPFGRGINLQIQTKNIDALYKSLQSQEYNFVIALEEKWYKAGNERLGNRQFVVADPDGYLLRFFQDLGPAAK